MIELPTWLRLGGTLLAVVALLELLYRLGILTPERVERFVTRHAP